MTRLTDQERTAITDAIRAGGTCRGIATHHNRSPDTIRRIAHEAGITDAFARTQTERATAAKRADNASRRAELVRLLLDDAHRLREQLWESAEYVSVTKDGAVVRYSQGRPTFADQRNVMTAVGIACDKAVALERVDQTDEHAGARGLLERLMEGIEGIAA